jgi:diaminopimelate epimerase
MCGNGLRCVAAYLHIKGKQGNNFIIATDMGDMDVKVVKTGKKTYFVEINMGILNEFE